MFIPRFPVQRASADLALCLLDRGYDETKQKQYLALRAAYDAHMLRTVDWIIKSMFSPFYPIWFLWIKPPLQNHVLKGVGHVQAMPIKEYWSTTMFHCRYSYGAVQVSIVKMGWYWGDGFLFTFRLRGNSWGDFKKCGGDRSEIGGGGGRRKNTHIHNLFPFSS